MTQEKPRPILTLDQLTLDRPQAPAPRPDPRPQAPAQAPAERTQEPAQQHNRDESLSATQTRKPLSATQTRKQVEDWKVTYREQALIALTHKKQAIIRNERETREGREYLDKHYTQLNDVREWVREWIDDELKALKALTEITPAFSEEEQTEKKEHLSNLIKYWRSLIKDALKEGTTMQVLKTQGEAINSFLMIGISEHWITDKLFGEPLI